MRGTVHVAKLDGREREVRVTRVLRDVQSRGKFRGLWRGVVVATGEQVESYARLWRPAVQQ